MNILFAAALAVATLAASVQGAACYCLVTHSAGRENPCYISCIHLSANTTLCLHLEARKVTAGALYRAGSVYRQRLRPINPEEQTIIEVPVQPWPLPTGGRQFVRFRNRHQMADVYINPPQMRRETFLKSFRQSNTCRVYTYRLPYDRRHNFSAEGIFSGCPDGTPKTGYRPTRNANRYGSKNRSCGKVQQARMSRYAAT